MYKIWCALRIQLRFGDLTIHCKMDREVLYFIFFNRICSKLQRWGSLLHFFICFLFSKWSALLHFLQTDFCMWSALLHFFNLIFKPESICLHLLELKSCSCCCCSWGTVLNIFVPILIFHTFCSNFDKLSFFKVS